MSDSNLPPGVRLRDVDGSAECPRCYGAGEIECADERSYPCPTCGGSGRKPSKDDQ